MDEPPIDLGEMRAVLPARFAHRVSSEACPVSSRIEPEALDENQVPESIRKAIAAQRLLNSILKSRRSIGVEAEAPSLAQEKDAPLELGDTIHPSPTNQNRQ